MRNKPEIKRNFYLLNHYINTPLNVHELVVLGEVLVLLLTDYGDGNLNVPRDALDVFSNI